MEEHDLHLSVHDVLINKDSEIKKVWIDIFCKKTAKKMRRGHLFSTFANFFKKHFLMPPSLPPFTETHPYVCVCAYQDVRNVSFSENLGIGETLPLHV